MNWRRGLRQAGNVNYERLLPICVSSVFDVFMDRIASSNFRIDSRLFILEITLITFLGSLSHIEHLAMCREGKCVKESEVLR